MVDIFKTTDGGYTWSLVKSIYPHNHSELSWGTSIRFGWSTSLHNNTLVVGAPYGGTVHRAGDVYIYEKDQDGPDQWGHVKNVMGDTIIMMYGWGVSVYGDWLCVGAKNYNDYHGAAYIYQRNEGGTNAWGQTQKIVQSDLEYNDQFGFSVSMYKNKLLISNHGNVVSGKNGNINLYELDNGTTWSEVANFLAIIPDLYF